MSSYQIKHQFGIHSFSIDDAFFDTVDLGVQNKSVGYKNAALQKVALFVNEKAEKFWHHDGVNLCGDLGRTYAAIKF